MQLRSTRGSEIAIIDYSSCTRSKDKLIGGFPGLYIGAALLVTLTLCLVELKVASWHEIPLSAAKHAQLLRA